MALQRILAVDDEPFNLEILEEILEDLNFDLLTASSGPECLEIIETFDPQVILLDVSMPQMNGYDVCRAIKANPETHHIVVMFVSARGSVEERMEGYAVGAEDYIVKPFGQGELKSKLMNLSQMLLDKDILEQQVEDATSTAFDAMATSSEMGQIVNYIEQISQVDDVSTLINAMIKCLSSFGLNCNAEVRVDTQRHHFATSGLCSPIVVELFDILKSKGRLHEFTSRILVNYDLVSVLILNMPSDENKHGRIRDHICFLVSVTEQQLLAIMTRKELNTQKDNLDNALTMINGKFKSLMGMLNTNRRQNESVFRSLQERFESKIPTMGLDEDQEIFIFSNVDEAIQNSVAREEAIDMVQSAFKEIEGDLSLLTDKS
ncbi:response regulator [Pseudoalteromonas sp. MMG013]|uniref:response regulator n=1 Tax=Pseudoalteromonas sp. MMG013 TaxID=2822687 RepID=UPI001B37A61C|nr:response regulator [Pseudoalteromonas sp. MMG013]MBQ4861215.1 response regulator [Pseudoalteromonas sp. MMG013]